MSAVVVHIKIPHLPITILKWKREEQEAVGECKGTVSISSLEERFNLTEEFQDGDPKA